MICSNIANSTINDHNYNQYIFPLLTHIIQLQKYGINERGSTLIVAIIIFDVFIKPDCNFIAYL